MSETITSRDIEKSPPKRMLAVVLKSKRRCGNCKNFDGPRGLNLLLQQNQVFARGVASAVSLDTLARRIRHETVTKEDGTTEEIEIREESNTGARFSELGFCSENPTTLFWKHDPCGAPGGTCKKWK